MANDVQLSKRDLKEAVRRVVLAQGNVFIRELLREHGIRIGLTKSDFQKNLDQAIDDGKLTQAMLEEWLASVEGWGNQHIYMHQPPAVAPANVRPLVEKSPFKALIDKTSSYDFPDTLTLTAVSVTGTGLSIVWYQSTSGWKRDEARDRHEEIDGDRYEFRAFRERFDRAVVRFEWRFGDPYCSILLQLPHEGNVHDAALAVVWTDLEHMNIAAAPLPRLSLSEAIKQLSRNKDVVTQTSKRMTAGGYVLLASTTPSSGIESVEAVREVFKGVNDNKFKQADGVFGLDSSKHKALDKLIKLQGYGEDSRLRVWVQCRRDEIFYLLQLVHEHSKAK